MVLVLHVLHAIEDFEEWIPLGIFDKLWFRLLKIYDNRIGIKWNWQSLDSISIKSPLGGQ